MDSPRRAEVARYAAPAAFLVALTIGVLLVRAALGGGGGGGEGVTALTGRTATVTPTATTTRTATTTVAASDAAPTAEETRFYTIERGDTLETVALKSGTSVDDLLRLNPGIDPHALRIGQKVRIG
jgi:LysM repeat protein